jgi:hypothetical protein
VASAKESAVKIHLLCLAFLCGLAATASAATYYVNNVGGNDGNSGSQSAPWATLIRPFNANLSPHVQSGDILYVVGNTGTTYTLGQDQTISPPSGLDAGHYTIVTAYPGVRPVIEAPNRTWTNPPPNENHGVFQIEIGRQYIEISGFEIGNTANPGDMRAAGILCMGNYVRLLNNHVYNTWASGIYVFASNHVVIDWCQIDHAQQRDISDGALAIDGSNDVQFTNGSVHDSPPAGPNGGANGVEVRANSSHVKVTGNDVYNVPTSSGIYVLASTTEISRNRIHACQAGITISNEGVPAGYVVDSVQVNNNLSYRNQAGIDVNAHFADATKRNIFIVNNTVCYNTVGGIGNTSTTVANLVIRNNISAYNGNGILCHDLQSGQDPSVDIQDDSNHAIIDHNLRSGVIFWYQPIDATSRIGDPLFCDAASDIFQVAYASPAIDGGSTVGAPTIDFEGNPRTTPYDIGAYEGARCPTGAAGPPTSALIPLRMEPRLTNGSQFTGTFDVKLSQSNTVFTGKTFGFTTLQPDCFTGKVELFGQGYKFEPLWGAGDGMVVWGSPLTLSFRAKSCPQCHPLSNSVASPDEAARLQLLEISCEPMTVRIRFALAKAAAPDLEIFDLAGRRVTHFRLPQSGVGIHTWESRPADSRLPKGIYFAVLTAVGVRDQKKIVVLR